MRLILATSNKGKIKEIKELCTQYDVLPYSDLMKSFEIEETAYTFKGNAIIKAQTIFNAINDKNAIVLADDSGISVPVLNFEPGIYSARYAGVGASDKDNLNKLINNLKAKNIKKTTAFYTAAIALVTKDGVKTAHGWMHGDVIDQIKGKNGFGYDPCFIPDGFTKTLGELDQSVKKNLSHRSKALSLIKRLLNYS